MKNLLFSLLFALTLSTALEMPETITIGPDSFLAELSIEDISYHTSLNKCSVNIHAQLSYNVKSKDPSHDLEAGITPFHSKLLNTRNCSEDGLQLVVISNKDWPIEVDGHSLPVKESRAHLPNSKEFPYIIYEAIIKEDENFSMKGNFHRENLTKSLKANGTFEMVSFPSDKIPDDELLVISIKFTEENRLIL